MSLRVRVTLLLSAAIILAVGFAGYATRETAVQPLRADLMRSHIHEAMQIARAIRQGSTLEDVREEDGPNVSLLDQSPARPAEVGPGKPWMQRRARGRPVLVRKGPAPAVALQLKRRWLLVESRISTDTQKLLWILIGGGLLLLGGAILVGQTVTRPLRDAQLALQRVGEGDLSQRLPIRGGEELEAVAESFNAMTERIATMLRAEKQLMAGISHELRTPLARLRLQTELLRDEGVDSTRLAQMEGNLEEIDHLVGEFMELSKLEAGASVLQLQAIQLQDLAEECVKAIPGDPPILLQGESQILFGDSARLKRVISTLLENALKYGEGSSIQVHVGQRSLSVSDQGPGVSTQDLPRLFEPFFRGSDTTSVRGYGIGLSMARQIISLHGGEISAKNQATGGLVIAFVLPPASSTKIDPDTTAALPSEV